MNEQGFGGSNSSEQDTRQAIEKIHEQEERERGVSLYKKLLNYIDQKIVRPYPLMNSAAEQEALVFLDDLKRVGPDKPVGYLPLRTLIEVCRVNPLTMKQELEERGLKVLILRERDIGTRSGALYAYDEAALQELLHNNKDILNRAGWPSDPELFVRKLKIIQQPGTDIYSLIARAFGHDNG